MSLDPLTAREEELLASFPLTLRYLRGDVARLRRILLMQKRRVAQVFPSDPEDAPEPSGRAGPAPSGRQLGELVRNVLEAVLVDRVRAVLEAELEEALCTHGVLRRHLGR